MTDLTDYSIADYDWTPMEWRARLRGRIYTIQDLGGDLPFVATEHVPGGGDDHPMRRRVGRYSTRDTAKRACEHHARGLEHERVVA